GKSGDGGGSYGGKGGKSGGGEDDDETYSWSASSPPKTDDAGWSATPGPKEDGAVSYGGKGGKSGSKASGANDDEASWHNGSLQTAQSDLKYSGSSVQAENASSVVRRIAVSLGAVAGAAVLLL
ncbi:hypothetical protein THAOC_31802, partial [Thalassiosira oceanica]